MTDLTVAPLWLLKLWEHYGTKELAGPRSNALIDAMFACTNGGQPAAGDETSWCSAALCFAFEQCNITSTRSKAARSWLTWGQPIAVPRLGCVAVFERYDPRNPNAGHVGLWVARVGGHDIIFGGNQGNELNVKPHLKDRVLGYRWPLSVP